MAVVLRRVWVALLCLAPLAWAEASCPELVGRWSLGPARAVDAAGGLVVLGRGSELVVVDVSQPAAASVVGRVELDVARDLRKAGLK